MQLIGSRRDRRATLRAAALAVVSSASASAFAQTSSTYIADANSSWSIASNWANGVIPDGGGVATFNELLSFTAAPRTVSQDLANVTLDRIEWNTLFTFSLTRPASTTNVFTLTGNAELRHNVPSAVGYGTTAANGQLVSSPFAGTVGLHKTGPGIVTISSTASTFSGGVFIEGGVLRIAGADTVLGNPSNSVTLNNGTLRNGATFTSSRQINLIGTGTVDTASSNTTFNGKFTGSGALTRIGSQVGTFTANNDFTGPFNLGGGSITVNGNGAFSATSSILANGTIVLDNGATNNGDRLNDAAPITFNGSGLILSGNAGGTTERLGATTIDRSLTGITVTPATGASAVLNSPSISRVNGGTVFYRGTSLGGTPGANVANVTYTAAPTLVGAGGAAGSTTISILPYAYGANASTINNDSASTSLVTYGPNGIRPLNLASEYQTSLTSATPADNVRLTSAQTISSPTAVNALVLSTGGTVSGTAPLTISSGVILASATSSIATPIDFGSAEGILHVPNTLTLAGAISGSNGLTKNGLGSLILGTTPSTYSGVTTVGGGTVYYGSPVGNGVPSPFGNSTTPIVLAGGDFNYAELYYAGGADASFERPLRVNSLNASLNTGLLPDFGVSSTRMLSMNGAIQLDSPLQLGAVAGSTLVLNGKISGPALLVGPGAGTVTINNGSNDYVAGTEMSLETWNVGADSPFGAGPIRITPPALSPGGPTINAVGGFGNRIISNNVFSLSGGNASSTFWTIGGTHDIEFSGQITLSNFGSPNGQVTHVINNTGVTTYSGRLTLGGIIKNGLGVLRLSGDSDYNSLTSVNSGILRVASSNALGRPTQGTVVANNATLEITDNAQSAEPVTINGNGAASGSLRSTGGSNTLGPITLASASMIGVDLNSSLKVGNVSGSFDLSKVGAGTLTADRFRVAAAFLPGGTTAVSVGRDAINKLSTISLLTLSGGSSPTSTLDLGNNDLLATATSAATLGSLISYARNGGAWDQAGLTSSVAKNEIPQVHTLGTLTGAEYTSVNSNPFDGVTPGATDGLVRFTYYGDTDFDDTITPSDIARLNAGLTNGSSGWLNGDVDSSGAVDFYDFARTDVAYTYINSTLTRATDYLNGTNPDTTGFDASLLEVKDNYSRFGEPYKNAFLNAVPEPMGLAVLGVVGMGAMSRRRRRDI